MKFSRTSLVGGSLALLLSAGPALAQVPMSARALGMGGAYVGVARGNDALFFNPANLGLPDNPAWSLTFPQVVIGGTTLGFAPTDLPEFVSTGELDAGERADLLDVIPGSGTEVGLNVRAPALSLQIGKAAVGVAYVTTGRHTLGKDLVDLVVNGYEEGRFDYDVGNTAGSRASYVDVAAGFGQQLGALSVGVTGHYYHGLGVMRSELFDPTYDIESRDITLQYAGVYSRGGSGWGVDLGAALQPTPQLTLSAAVTNVLGQMSWSEELEYQTVDFTRENFQMSYSRARSFQMRFDNSVRPLDGSTSADIVALGNGLTEGAEVPSQLRVGLGWAPLGGTQVGLSYESTLREGGLAAGWETAAAAGIEQKLGFLGLRAGYATDLESASLLSGGVSIGGLNLGLGKLVDGAVDGADREGWVVTLGLGTSHGRR